ncbi:hypothetical protein ACIQC9_00040 [Brevundimonas sp. NPDC092305]|uniref:hypothetical protein n=1 Tax=Brevundimonas sp. NPDC092305 TaxID=3363957 RepID=UPI0037FDE64F
MRNPYQPRRDYSKIGLIVLGGLVAAVVVLLAVYVFRPESSPSEKAAETAMEQQMDRSEAASAERRREAESRRRADFQ